MIGNYFQQKKNKKIISHLYTLHIKGLKFLYTKYIGKLNEIVFI